jgi:hypothetical protein
MAVRLTYSVMAAARITVAVVALGRRKARRRAKAASTTGPNVNAATAPQVLAGGI